MLFYHYLYTMWKSTFGNIVLFPLMSNVVVIVSVKQRELQYKWLFNHRAINETF